MKTANGPDMLERRKELRRAAVRGTFRELRLLDELPDSGERQLTSLERRMGWSGEEFGGEA